MSYQLATSAILGRLFCEEYYEGYAAVCALVRPEEASVQHMPSNVALFERLMYLSLGIGVIVSLLTWNQNVTTAQAVGGAAFVFFVQAFTFAFIVLFIWLIARRRNNWARWFLLGISILGLPFSLRMLGRMLLSNPIASSTDMLLCLVGTLNFAQLMAELNSSRSF